MGRAGGFGVGVRRGQVESSCALGRPDLASHRGLPWANGFQKYTQHIQYNKPKQDIKTRHEVDRGCCAPLGVREADPGSKGWGSMFPWRREGVQEPHTHLPASLLQPSPGKG